MELTAMEKKIIEQYRLGANIEISNFNRECTYEEATDLVNEFGKIDHFMDVYHEYENSHSVIVGSNFDEQVQISVSFEE